MSKFQLAVGPCPVCQRKPTWFNDVPLRAFCWGTESREHSEASCVVPWPAQPYGRGPMKAAWRVEEVKVRKVKAKCK